MCDETGLNATYRLPVIAVRTGNDTLPRGITWTTAAGDKSEPPKK
jgi:hypothetical protein